MSRVCRKCGWWINFFHGAWRDEYDDDTCYNEVTLTQQGYHEPEE